MACDVHSLCKPACARSASVPIHFFRITQLHPALRTLQENCTPRNEAPLTHQGLTATTHLDLSHLTLLQCARLTPARAPILRRSSLQNISPPCIATSASHTPLAHKLPLCSSSSSSPAYAAIHPLQCPRHSTLRQQNPLFTSKRASCPCCKHVSSENGEEPPSPLFSSR